MQSIQNITMCDATKTMQAYQHFTIFQFEIHLSVVRWIVFNFYSKTACDASTNQIRLSIGFRMNEKTKNCLTCEKILKSPRLPNMILTAFPGRKYGTEYLKPHPFIRPGTEKLCGDKNLIHWLIIWKAHGNFIQTSANVCHCFCNDHFKLCRHFVDNVE